MKNRLLVFSVALSILLFVSACAPGAPAGRRSAGIWTKANSMLALSKYIPEPTTDCHDLELAEPEIPFPRQPGEYLERFTSHNTGNFFDYYIFLPENVEYNMPLIIFLHGDGEVGQAASLKNYGPVVNTKKIYGDDYPFILLLPNTRVASWTLGDIPDTLMELIEYIADEYQIDRSRIILTGHSRGAMGAWWLLGKYGDYFSAAVPISCGPGVWIDYDNCAKVPIRAFCGDQGESELTYKAGMEWVVNLILEAGGDVEFTIMKGYAHGETVFGAFTEELFNWMLEQ